ncbi:hypothetical protein ACA910_011083 [Epithemia clementina (nom. ined.)]
MVKTTKNATAFCAALLVSHFFQSTGLSFQRSFGTAQQTLAAHSQVTKIASEQQCSRLAFLYTFIRSGAVLGAACSYPLITFAAEAEGTGEMLPQRSVEACPKQSQGSSNNCVSTASVRQMDLYMAPWTYPKDMTKEEVLGRIKGALSSNNRIEVVEQTEYSLKVQAIRNFCKDEIQFFVNPEDHVVTFSSRQIDGPDTPDFGENRKRLEDIRRRVGVFGVMGEDVSDYFYGAESSSQREGALGQLKAFYGLRSGRGFEDILLDEDDN